MDSEIIDHNLGIVHDDCLGVRKSTDGLCFAELKEINRSMRLLLSIGTYAILGGRHCP